MRRSWQWKSAAYKDYNNATRSIPLKTQSKFGNHAAMSTSEAVHTTHSPDAAAAGPTMSGLQKREEYSKSLVLAKLKASTTDVLSPGSKAALKFKSPKLMRSRQTSQSSTSGVSSGIEAISSQAPHIVIEGQDKLSIKNVAPKAALPAQV